MKTFINTVLLLLLPAAALASGGHAAQAASDFAGSFGCHLKWTPVIALGYVASIICHLLINARLF